MIRGTDCPFRLPPSGGSANDLRLSLAGQLVTIPKRGYLSFLEYRITEQGLIKLPRFD